MYLLQKTDTRSSFLLSDRDGEGCLQKLSDDGHSFSKKHDIAQGKPVNNLTLDIRKRVVHNELTFMIFIENAGGRNDGRTI